MQIRIESCKDSGLNELGNTQPHRLIDVRPEFLRSGLSQLYVRFNLLDRQQDTIVSKDCNSFRGFLLAIWPLTKDNGS